MPLQISETEEERRKVMIWKKFVSLGFVILLGTAGGVMGEADELSVARAFAEESIGEHLGITQYDGPATCVGCHETEAKNMFGAVHYQWTGPTPNVPNIAGDAGKADLGFNTYCGTVVSSRHIACWTCHVGNGGTPSSEMTVEQLGNIDCLMCHQQAYQRKAAPPFETLTFKGYDNVTRSWQLPVEDPFGNFQFMADEANMQISMAQAAQTVHRPNRVTCLRCHAYAAGSNCGKRGDLSAAIADPPENLEVHMAVAGANLSCQGCHRFKEHRALGRGLDLRPNERPERLNCLTGGCHNNPPHGSARLNQHTARVACQTCHIPTYAKLGITTEVRRDWNFPFFAQGLFDGQGGFKPEEFREADLIPSYAWFDGTSRVYALGQVPPQNSSTGEYELGLPNGSVSSIGAQIHPMKEHWSNSAMLDATGQLIPHSTFTYFVTGDFARAVEEGMKYDHMTGNWHMVDVHTYQTINHGVEPKANALDCGQCHEAYSTGSVRMDLPGKLGYALKGPKIQICTQCHELEDDPLGFEALHRKHVEGEEEDEEGFDCSRCHNFTRPERGLNPVSVQISTDSNDTTLPMDVDFRSSVQGGESPYTYLWRFGDGQESTQANPSHTYDSEGSYTVVLTVTDRRGYMSLAQTTVDSNPMKLKTPLNMGWNLVSFPLFPKGADIEQALNPVDGLYTLVWGYQNRSWQMFDPISTLFNDLNSIDPSRGYWIGMTQSRTLEAQGIPAASSINLTDGWNLVGYNNA